MEIAPQHNDIIFYSSPDGNVKIEVVFNDETFWLTQKRMAELFGVKVPAISKHLSNIFETKELEENSVVSILETTAAESKNYEVEKCIYYDKSLEFELIKDCITEDYFRKVTPLINPKISTYRNLAFDNRGNWIKSEK
jgi:hypothetical protein